MRSLSIAEWMLRRVKSKEQSAAMVGDLLEIRAERGDTWFWFTLCKLLARQVGPPVLGYFAALFVSNRLMYDDSLSPHTIYSHNPPDGWGVILMGLAPILILPWILATYLAIRFGLRDHMARTAFCWAVLSTIIVHLWWQPVVLETCVLIAVGGLLFMFALQAERRASFGILIAVAGSCVAGIVCTFLAYKYRTFVAGPFFGIEEMHEHPSVHYVSTILYCLMVALIAKTASWVHRWQVQADGTGPDSVDEQTTSGSSN